MRPDDDDEDWDESCSEETGDDDPDLEPTRDCPYCGFEMLEICDRCPSCGQYPSKEDTQHEQGQPRWVILAGFLCLAIMLFWILLRL